VISHFRRKLLEKQLAGANVFAPNPDRCRHAVRIPHQFLLNDIESILPCPLETGAGCGLVFKETLPFPHKAVGDP
jgi:hypothetical protein